MSLVADVLLATIKKTDLKFQSPTWGEVSLSQMFTKTRDYIHSYPEGQYRLVVGSDSHPAVNGKDTIEYITAFVIHRVGAGGIYFWHKTVGPKVFNLRDRIYTESLLSLQAAQILIEYFDKYNLLKFDLEIHADIGPSGKTREMITEVTGMIRGSGFKCLTKPDSYGASKVADRHT
jgi:predicted RNase H-related nuclease YkuK (DUF458 family)